MGKVALTVVILVFLGVVGGVYYGFTASQTQELDEASPLDAARPAVVKDALDTMNESTRLEFEAAVDASQGDVKQMNEDMPVTATAPTILSQGTFQRRAHGVSGTAKLIEHDGEKILRFEDFETINGPNLHIYLASDLSGDDFIDLGPLRATKGNVNYAVPANVDTSKYNKVLVWCVPFKVTFSYADLQ